MPMGDEQRRHGPKIGEKNGRSEERPSSGRKRPGRAAASQSRIAIPRCNNMTKSRRVRKQQSIINSRQNAAETLEKSVTIARFFAHLLPPLALLQCSIAQTKVNAADSSHRRNHATKDSRGSAIRRPQSKAGDTRWPKLRGLKMCLEASTRATRRKHRQPPR